jgi:hypothetical protein
VKRSKILLAVAGVAALLGAGGAVAFASIPNSNTHVITGCYTTTGTLKGSLRVIDAQAGQTCKSGETRLTWNQAGPIGPAGPQGPTGPGATAFSQTVSGQFSGLLFNTNNGLQVVGDCSSSSVGVRLLPQGFSTDSLQASGTMNNADANTEPVDIDAPPPLPNNQATAGDENNSVRADLDLVARAGSGNFARVDAHGERSGSSCTYWGMVTPTS